MSPTTAPNSIAQRMPFDVTVAEPDIAGSLAVFPLIALGSPSVRYISFAQGLRRGVRVKELAGGASVGDLVVHNPLDVPVLLYEGQEVLGAQQNRTFDVSALVAPGATLSVPVSCVEAGRWDGRRHAEPFALAPQAAYPELRRRKNERVRERLAASQAPRAEQGEVWDEIAAKASRVGVQSPTGAMHDLFEGRRSLLDAMAGAIDMKCSQVGMLAAIGGRFVVLDLVSEVEAFADLHAPLVQGYALDALESAGQLPAPPPSHADARDFAELLFGAAADESPALGTGATLRFEFGKLAGTGLSAADELVALTAFPQAA